MLYPSQVPALGASSGLDACNAAGRKGSRPKSARLPRSGASENVSVENVLRKQCRGASENVFVDNVQRKSLGSSENSRPPRAPPSRVGLQDITNQEHIIRDTAGLEMNARSTAKRAAPPCSSVPVLAAAYEEGYPTEAVAPSLPLASCAAQGLEALAANAPEILEPANHKRMCTETTNVWTGDNDNVQYVSEYAPEVFASLLRNESKFLPQANYVDLQKDINSKMRGILVDWLVEVHAKYRMRPETLHLTISTVDRYLTRMPIPRSRLQLVGVSGMSIAAKYEEINPPVIEDYVYITDDTYTKDEILAMECQMLTTLDFQVAVPTAAHLLGPLLRMNDCDESHKEFVNYLTELALLDHNMLRFPPSHVVSAAILLSNDIAGRAELWSAVLREQTQQSEELLRPCAQQLRKLLDKVPEQQLQAICRKYQSRTHREVASRWPRQ